MLAVAAMVGLMAASSSRAAEPLSCANPTGEALSAPVSELTGRQSRLRSAASPRPATRPRVQVVYFGASWCGPCRLQVRTMRDAYAAGEPARLGYEVLFVSRDETAEAATAYAAGERMPWAYLPPGAGGRAGEISALSGRSVPDMVVVDSKGRILCRAYGPDGRYRGVSQVFDALRRDLASRSR